MIAKISAGLAVTAVIFTACAQTNGPMAGGGEPTPPAAGTGDPVAGRTLFLHNCAHCHGANARGDDGPDLHGLDETDRNLMMTIMQKYGGGPVGLNTIAASMSEEEDAIEEIYEPYLMQLGLLDRTQRGRVATALAYQHFGMEVPRRQQPLF